MLKTAILFNDHSAFFSTKTRSSGNATRLVRPGGKYRSISEIQTGIFGQMESAINNRTNLGVVSHLPAKSCDCRYLPITLANRLTIIEQY